MNVIYFFLLSQTSHLNECKNYILLQKLQFKLKNILHNLLYVLSSRDYTGTIKGSRASLTSSIPLDSDDDGMTDMYGDPDIGRFGEDGSFLGQYATDKKKSNNIYDNNHV